MKFQIQRASAASAASPDPSRPFSGSQKQDSPPAREQYYKTDFAITQFMARFWCIIWGAKWCLTQYLFVAAIKAAL